MRATCRFQARWCCGAGLPATCRRYVHSWLPRLIGGETLSGSRRLEVRNPAHPEEVVGIVVRGSAEDVCKAVAPSPRLPSRTSAATAAD